MCWFETPKHLSWHVLVLCGCVVCVWMLFNTTRLNITVCVDLVVILCAPDVLGVTSPHKYGCQQCVCNNDSVCKWTNDVDVCLSLFVCCCVGKHIIWNNSVLGLVYCVLVSGSVCGYVVVCLWWLVGVLLLCVVAKCYEKVGGCVAVCNKYMICNKKKTNMSLCAWCVVNMVVVWC